MLMNEFCNANKITMEHIRVPSNPHNDGDEWAKHAKHYKCSLLMGEKTMDVFFSMGSAHQTPPTVYDVLDCLASDASGLVDKFEDWAREYGYDPDSRKAERTYNAVREISGKLSEFLGKGLFKTLLDEVERL